MKNVNQIILDERLTCELNSVMKLFCSRCGQVLIRMQGDNSVSVNMTDDMYREQVQAQVLVH